MRDLIFALDDATAVRVLTSFVKARLREGSREVEWVPEVRDELVRAFGVTSARNSTPSEGDLARQALTVLAEDPQYREALRAQLKNPSPERFVVVESVAVVTAALVVLQTHVKFERGKDGRISLKVEKKPTSDSLLKPLVQQLLAFLGIGPREAG